MSYPILYNATETNFDHNGIGILSACVSCEVTEEANGIFELAMQYPMDGVHFSEIGDRAIIKARADQFRDPQLFRVYAISKPMNGIVTVLAEHISYDLSGIPVKPFSASTAYSALTELKNNAVVDCPFIFWTDKTTSANFKVETPSSIRSRLGGVAGSILDVYGGDYEFDNYTVKLHNNRGMNRGVSIRYGKNLTDIQQDQNCSNVATGVYPYWFLETDAGNVLVELPEKIVSASGTYNFVRIRTLDLSSEFDVQPTHEQLRKKTQEYIKANNIGVPVVSLSVSFAQLEQTEEYKHLKLLERVSLFDAVNVEFPALGVSATAKAVKMVYDVIAERVKSVTLGSVRANIADTIATQAKEIEKKPSKTFMQTAVEALTKTILGASGGSVRLLDENGDGEPDTLYIADNPDPTQAVKVWRFNYEGWGASDNGYNGPFKLGATFKDGIIADFITAGTLYGLLIKAGTIESLDGKISIDLTSGNRVLLNSGITSNDLIIRSTTGEELLRVFVNQISDTFSDEYLSFVGRYRDGSTMFQIGTLGAVLPGENEKDVGSSIKLFSSSGGIGLSSNVNGSGIQLTNTNTSPMTIASILLQNDGDLAVDIGDNVYRNLSWEFSTELQKYILCGL
jgi:phage minor structural protein